MPPPKFVTCQICGRGFGSASIGIHIPQCYDKALKRWQLDPTGPRPVMPQMQTGKGKTGLSGKDGFDVPVGAGGAAARSLKANNVGMTISEAPPENMNLHPCSKCGRKFNYDRISYHESVCKGDRRRPVFDSTKQRMPEDALEGGGSFGYSGRSSAKRKGKKGSAAPASSSPAVARYPRIPPSTWRQQHEEFIEAVRYARRSGAESKAMWGNPSSSPAGRRQPGGVSRAAPRDAPIPPRVPSSMVKQNEFRKANMVSGGRAARVQSNSINTPAPNGAADGGLRRTSTKTATRSSAFGGGGDRFARYGPGGAAGGGGGGGGGGPVRIVNDNTTSIGMNQAFGRA